MKEASRAKKLISAAIGAFETLAGALLAAYIVAWLLGYIRWSADIAFAAMAAVALFFVIDGIARIKRSKSILAVRSRTVNAILQSALIAGVATLVLVQCVIWDTRGESNADPTDYVVIFGAKIYGSSPSPMLSGRIYAAAQYLTRHPDAVAIACGGFSDGETYSEAQVIRSGLVGWGIDETRIILEENSTDSSESAQNAAAIILAQNEGHEKTVTVVTSDYHLYRCKRLFERLGFETYGCGADVALYLRPIAHFREMLSILRDYALEVTGALGSFVPGLH